MIIIFNTGGLLVGCLGAAAGFGMAVLTGKIELGLLALGAVWFVFGWGKYDERIGQRKPSPSLFFIPLRILSFGAAGLAACVWLVPGTDATSSANPSKQALRAHEKELDQTLSGGDTKLSSYIRTVLTLSLIEEAEPEKYHVLTQVKDQRVLVLVKAPNLKAFAKSERRKLLETITRALEERPQTKGRKFYIGIKGRILFGAVQAPPGRTVKTGTIVTEDPLLGFYNPPAQKGVPPKTNQDPALPRPEMNKKTKDP